MRKGILRVLPGVGRTETKQTLSNRPFKQMHESDGMRITACNRLPDFICRNQPRACLIDLNKAGFLSNISGRAAENSWSASTNICDEIVPRWLL